MNANPEISPDQKQIGRTRRIVGRILYSFVILFLAAVALPNFVKVNTAPSKNFCVSNLKQVEGAIEQWALENGLKDGEMVIDAEVAEYLKGGAYPKCHATGEMVETSTVGTTPTCPSGLAGHSL